MNLPQQNILFTYLLLDELNRGDAMLDFSGHIKKLGRILKFA